MIGLEKEGLRVTPDGTISQTSHPKSLGAALTNRYITTDYSEALTELITPPLPSAEAAMAFLTDTQKFVYSHLDDELLWSSSMPCVVSGGENIPIAEYGTSNAGVMKTVYRRGLGHRYGRTMQVIAGIHFNYSPPESFWPAFQRTEGDTRPLQDFISDRYFGMIRNIKRNGWLISYLFGASPALCKSFFGGKPSDLNEWDAKTYYAPYATSLRMADIGYQNSKEKCTGINVCYNSLESYVEALTHAIESSCPEYEKIGVVKDGVYQQLNSNILQIENEYYSSVRPKQIPIGFEKPTLALKRRGVRYVELRSLDINPFLPLGLDRQQLHFLEAFLITSLLMESPFFTPQERRELDSNDAEVSYRGRMPGLKLQRNGEQQSLAQWANEYFQIMQPVCELLDQQGPDAPYQKSLQHMRGRIDRPETTPSARILEEMQTTGESFFELANRLSIQHRNYFERQILSSESAARYTAERDKSIAEQRAIEASDRISFGEFLDDYFSQK